MFETFANFTPVQQQHAHFMQLVAKSFNDTPMILKGGTALMLAYGLDRYSEDLDFDSTKPISPEARIKQAVRTTKINITDIKIKKDTNTAKRWMVYYSGPDGIGSLKIEVSFRQDQINPDAYCDVNNIRVYKLSELIRQKLHAARERSKIRDLYDLAYLSRESREHFSKENCEELFGLSKDSDALYSRYEPDHAEDSILQGEDLYDLVLTLSQSAEELMDLHDTEN